MYFVVVSWNGYENHFWVPQLSVKMENVINCTYGFVSCQLLRDIKSLSFPCFICKEFSVPFSWKRRSFSGTLIPQSDFTPPVRETGDDRIWTRYPSPARFHCATSLLSNGYVYCYIQTNRRIKSQMNTIENQFAIMMLRRFFFSYMFNINLK